MRKMLTIGLMITAAAPLGACATNRYNNDPYYGVNENRRDAQGALAGAAVGGAVGAGVGAVVGGVSSVEGAVAGAVVGGLVGAATANDKRRWHRDERGECFWVDERGYRVYDYDARC